MKKNYIQGTFESFNDINVGSFIIDEWTHIKLDGYFKFLFSDPVLKLESSGVVIPTSDYDLLEDDAYTAREAETGGSGKTVYAQIRVTNATYAGVDLTLSGSNFGSYADNEAVANILPIGIPVPSPIEIVPDGWITYEGGTELIAEYPLLYAFLGTRYGGDGITTFGIPDYRGYALRGWDHGAGIDPDAASRTDRGDGTTGDFVGTKQEDEFNSHDHTVFGSLTGGVGTTRRALSGTGGDDVQSAYSGGNETRMKNINVLWIARAR